MRNLIALLVIALVLVSSAFAQEQRNVGVEFRPYGFQDNIEAEKFMASVMNLDLQDPSSPVHFVQVADRGERKMVVNITIRAIKNYTGQEGLKKQGIRLGLNALLSAAPSSVRGNSNLQNLIRTGRNTLIPNVYIYYTEYIVTSTVYMYRNGNIVWRGADSRTLTVKETRYQNNTYPKAELEKGGDVGELIPYGDAFAYPQDGNINGKRNQILAFLVFRTSVDEKHRVRGGNELLRQGAQ